MKTEEMVNEIDRMFTPIPNLDKRTKLLKSDDRLLEIFNNIINGGGIVYLKIHNEKLRKLILEDEKIDNILKSMLVYNSSLREEKEQFLTTITTQSSILEEINYVGSDVTVNERAFIYSILRPALYHQRMTLIDAAIGLLKGMSIKFDPFVLVTNNKENTRKVLNNQNLVNILFLLDIIGYKVKELKEFETLKETIFFMHEYNVQLDMLRVYSYKTVFEDSISINTENYILNTLLLIYVVKGISDG